MCVFVERVCLSQESSLKPAKNKYKLQFPVLEVLSIICFKICYNILKQHNSKLSDISTPCYKKKSSSDKASAVSTDSPCLRRIEQQRRQNSKWSFGSSSQRRVSDGSNNSRRVSDSSSYSNGGGGKVSVTSIGAPTVPKRTSSLAFWSRIDSSADTLLFDNRSGASTPFRTQTISSFPRRQQTSNQIREINDCGSLFQGLRFLNTLVSLP